MSKFTILTKTEEQNGLHNFLKDLQNDVELRNTSENIDADFLVIDENYNDPIIGSFRQYKYCDFLNIISAEFISIGTTSQKIFNLFKKAMPEVPSILNASEGKGNLESDYILIEHNKGKDYSFDYVVITDNYTDFEPIINNTTRKNIVFGDSIGDHNSNKNFYFGLKDDNDFVIKDITEEDTRLKFNIVYNDEIINSLDLDKRLKGYTREIVALAAVYYLENLSFNRLKEKLDSLI